MERKDAMIYLYHLSVLMNRCNCSMKYIKTVLMCYKWQISV